MKSSNLFVQAYNRVAPSLGVVKTQLVLAALAVVSLTGSLAHATVTLPDTGADPAGLVGAAITAIGAIIAVVVGGYFAFLVIKKAMTWAKRMA